MRLQNGTPFGLTGGIHSLDDDEVSYWLDHVEVGNAYVNRHITGAIVSASRSVAGNGRRWAARRRRADRTTCTPCCVPAAAPVDVDAATENYRTAWPEHFADAHDATGLRSESNVLRHLPVGRRRRARRRRHAPRRRRRGDRGGRGSAASRSPSRRVAERIGGRARRPARHARRRPRLRALTAIGDELAAACHALDIADRPRPGER